MLMSAFYATRLGLDSKKSPSFQEERGLSWTA